MTIEYQLICMIDELSAHLPTEVVAHVRDCVDAGELQLALEETCAYVGEAGYKFTAEQAKAIEQLARELGVDGKWWRTA